MSSNMCVTEGYLKIIKLLEWVKLSSLRPLVDLSSIANVNNV